MTTTLQQELILAEEFRREHRLDGLRYCDPFLIFRECKIAVSPLGTSGCSGVITDHVRVSSKGTVIDIHQNARHEAGHLVQFLSGIWSPHCERTTTRLGLVLVISEQSIILGLNTCEFESQALRSRYPSVSLLNIYRRIAIALGYECFVFPGRSRHWLTEYAVNDNAPEWIDEMLAEQARLEAWNRSKLVEYNDGRVAIPVDENNRRYIVVLAPRAEMRAANAVHYDLTEKVR